LLLEVTKMEENQAKTGATATFLCRTKKIPARAGFRPPFSGLNYSASVFVICFVSCASAFYFPILLRHLAVQGLLVRKLLRTDAGLQRFGKPPKCRI